jgi:hypothetical protein
MNLAQTHSGVEPSCSAVGDLIWLIRLYRVKWDGKTTNGDKYLRISNEEVVIRVTFDLRICLERPKETTAIASRNDWYPGRKFNWVLSEYSSRVSSVGIAAGYGLDCRGSITCRGKRFSLLQSVQTGSGGHPVSYSMGIGGSFLGGKEAWSWPFASI